MQECPAYGIHAMMVGTLLGVTFGGRSGVYAPLALDALRPLRQEPLARLRPELYGRYLPSLYEGASQRALQESER